MKFEIGKYYQHTGGMMISILGELNSTAYGKCLVAEEANQYNFSPVGMDEDATQNWTEITKGKWLSNFSRENELPPVFTEKLLRVGHIHAPRYYPYEIGEAIVDEYEAGRKFYGSLDSPEIPDPDYVIPPEDISHEIKNLRLVDDALIGDIYILDTPKGKLLWEIMQETDVKFITCAYIVAKPMKDATNISKVTECKVVSFNAIPKGQY